MNTQVSLETSDALEISDALETSNAPETTRDGRQGPFQKPGSALAGRWDALVGRQPEI